MQRIRFNRGQLIRFLISIAVIALLVLVDQLAKNYFVALNEEENLALNKKKVLGDFFYFTFLYNTGSAYGMFAGKVWAQTFFAVITPIAALVFLIVLLYAVKNNYKMLIIAVVMILSGTLGNYIDRIAMGKVVDFLCIQIFGNRLFGVFNIADVYLSFGMVIIVIHLLFLDKNAVFGKKHDERKN